MTSDTRVDPPSVEAPIADGKTLVVLHELYPSKEALDRALAGMEGRMPETFAQLDELLGTLGASVGRS
jgi:hypothetical protein